MSFKSSYIYIFFVLASIILVRENFDFTTGDREAYLYGEWLAGSSIRDRLTNFIFTNLKFFGEILFCLLYYRNVFKLSTLLFLSTKFKDYLNKRIVYFSILLALFAPVTLIFTSFAGKDITAIFLASELCVEISSYYYKKKAYKFNFFKIIKILIFSILLVYLRKLSAFFFLILLLNFFILFNRNQFKNLPFILFPILIISIFLFWDQLYGILYEEFYYQYLASFSENATFSKTNPNFEFDNFLQNSYQMITGVAPIHFSESFNKAFLLLLNNFLTHIFTLILGIIYFIKNLKIRNLFFFKAFFLISFFIINGFFSQNNPGGAIRFMSSVVPIYTTFIFTVLPE